MSHEVGRRHLWVLDAIVVVWVTAWVVVGVRVGIDLRTLGQLATTVGDAGEALGQTAKGLKAISEVPLLGGELKDLGKLADQLNTTASSAQANAVAARSSADHLGYLLAVVIALVPALPILGIYLPFRISRIREKRAIQTARRAGVNVNGIDRYLANRALVNLPYHRLGRVSADPWTDVAEGRYDDLADAELRRLGFDPRRRRRV